MATSKPRKCVLILGAAGRDFHIFNVCFRELDELASSIAAVDCDTMVIATPVDLARLIPLTKPSCRVRYDFEEISPPSLADVVTNFVRDQSDRLLHR